MSAIKTPVRVVHDDGADLEQYSFSLVGADEAILADSLSREVADRMAVALNACAGLTVEALEQGVVERAIELALRAGFPSYSYEAGEQRELHAFIDTTKLRAAPNSEAGHD